MSVKFDNQELVGGTYIPRFFKHESATERELNIQSLARDDGAVFVNDRRGIKTIIVQGILTAATEALLDAAIDSFKELFGRQEKNLDIDWAGSTRRYIATCKEHNFDRDHYNLSNVPWTAVFIVSSGVGKDTTITAEKHNVTLNANPYSWTSTFAGSANPKPLITLEFGAGHTYPRGIQLKNTTTGQKIIFNKTTALANGDTIVIDFENKKITLEGVEQPFYGVFPDLIIGANALEISIADILDQYSPNVGVGGYLVAGDDRDAQGIVVPNTDSSYRMIGVYCLKNGTPAEALRVEIQTDLNGAPSGDLVDADAYGTIAAADVAVTAGWLYCHLQDNVQLNSNTPYWIVCKSAGSTIGNDYEFPATSGALAAYSKGTIARTDDAEATWTITDGENLGFRLYYGGVQDLPNMGAVVLDVDYYKRYL